RTTVQASNAFLDSIQRLADLASKTTGGSKEIGAHFTRLCMRQKRLGTKVKTMGNQLITCMVNPLSTHMDEWKKTLSQIEKDHNREAKRARGDLKRALSEANRLKRKLSKQGSSNSSSLHSRQNSGGSTIGRGVGLGEPPTSNRSIPPSVPSGIGTSSLKVRTDSAIKNLEEKVRLMEDLERASIKRLMLEERGRYCFFFNCLRPVLETETSLLGEITTLRELFTALSTATQNPSQLLDDAESVLAHTGGRVDGHSISPNGPLRSSAVNEVEAFASAVDAIMSSKQRQKREEATLSLASESFCSTSSGCSDGKNNVSGPSGSSSSPHSSQMSVHSAGSSVFALNGLNGIPAPQHQMAQILRQPRTQTDVVPRSASVGRPAVVGANQRIVSSYGADDVVLRRPANLGATAVSPRQRPLTATAPVAEPASLQLSASSTLGDPSPNQRTSTCTLQLDDATPRANTRLQTDDEAGDETASGTAEDEVSDDGLLSEDRRPSTYSTGEAWRPPNAISSEHRSLSRGGDLNKMLYPDQSLPPPVYTNLNKLTHAAQRKFSMSTATSPNADGVAWQADLESDNISIASAPHTQPDRAHTNGIYSVPESPNRPSYSTSSSISRPRGSSVGMEDPFSVEMDELDRMVTELHSLNTQSLRPSLAHSPGGLETRPITEAGDSMFCIPTFYSNQSFGDLNGTVDEVFVLPPRPSASMRPRLRAGSDTPMQRTPTNTLSTISLSRLACGRSSLPPPVPYRTSSLRRPAKRKDV
uniref:IMD domain-containing protein n=1 Tax=Mesocestoides corti TaxID=53468 RepID=A0A5K3FHI2_MESCO